MEYKFFAFISYSHADIKTAKRLQSLLEHYHLPTALQKERNLPKRFKVFRDTDELTSGELNDELRNKLEESNFLIVICSPASAKSIYVGNEISYFRQLGRQKRIIPFIIDGKPHGEQDSDCFNPQMTAGNLELLGIEVKAEDMPFQFLRFHKAFIRLVAKMLNLDFGVLWNRRRIYFVKQLIYVTLILSIITGLAMKALREKPFDMQVTLQNPIKDLPLSVQGNDSIYLFVEEGDVRAMPVKDLASEISFLNLPGRYKGQLAKIQGTIYGFEKLDTSIVLEQETTLYLQRIPSIFGHICYLICDDTSERSLPNVDFNFGFSHQKTDEKGLLLFDVPIEQQKACYPVHISQQGRNMHLKYRNKEDVIYPSLKGDTAILYICKD